MSSSPTPVILDCDPGIDDALAIALLAAHPAIELAAITTVAGNVPLNVTTTNALRLREFYRADDVPVYAGADAPLRREPVFAGYVHGEDGLGGAPVPAPTRAADDGYAPEVIVELLRERPGEITLVAVGPMTNIALALRAEPQVAQWAKSVVLMGGAFTRGNITPAAEFNFFADPDAAAEVFAAPWQPVLTSLDVTLRARVTDDVLARWSGYGPLSELLLMPSLANYFDNRAAGGVELDLPESVARGGRAPAIHDACAAAYVIDPSLFTALPAHTAVETRGELTAGMSVVDFTPHGDQQVNSTVLTDIDTPRFFELMGEAFETLSTRLQRR